MNKRFKHLIALGILSVTLVSNHFVVSAVDKPTKPDSIAEDATNEQITEYNRKVEKYNKQADEYNQEIDEKYAAAVASVQQQNSQIDEHNKAEEAKVKEIEAANIERQKEYDALYTQYQKDLNVEKQLQEKYGYESTAAYNEYAKTHYNDVVDAALEKNADPSRVFDIDKSYEITPGEELSSGNSDTGSTDEPEEPEKVKVHIEHNFTNTNTVYTKDFEINENDILTLYSAGSQLEPIRDGECAYFMYSPEELRQGSWYLSMSMAYDTANYKDSSGWKNGNIYVISYKDGKKHPGDSTDIDMIFEYTWMPLNKWPLYNVPVKPELNLETYTPDIKEHVAEPTKEEHLEHLGFVELKPEKPKDETSSGNAKPEPEKPKDETSSGNAKPDVPKEVTPGNAEEPNPAPPKEETRKDDPQPAPAPHDNNNNNNEINNNEPKKEIKKKKKHTKKENNNQTEENKSQETKKAEIKPTSTSSIVIPQQKNLLARRGSTEDKSITRLRICIIIVCAVALISAFVLKDR